MVAELDSLLNQWIDTVPDHCESDMLIWRVSTYMAHECAVRWNPNMKDLTFFNQSAYLHAFYFQIQIIVHRQWIPSAKYQIAVTKKEATVLGRPAETSASQSSQAETCLK